MIREQRIALPMLAVFLSLLAGCDNSPKEPNTGWGLGPGYHDPAAIAAAEAEANAKAFCALYLRCASIDMKVADCVKELKAIVTFLPDPQRTLACLQTKACPPPNLKLLELLEVMSKILADCLQLDPHRMSCVGGTVYICDLYGTCKTTNCTEYCAMSGYTKGECGKSISISVEDYGPCDCSGAKRDGGVKPIDMFVPAKG